MIQKKTFKHQIYKSIIICTMVSVLIMGALVGCNTGNNESTSDTSQETQKNTEDLNDVSVMFINVGRADATLVQINGCAYLIDTGEKSSVPALYRALALQGVKKLEAVFLTHTNSDHIGGMEALTKKYNVDTLYSVDISKDKKNGENKISNLAAELLLKYVKLTAGNRVDLAPDTYFEVLGPLVYNDGDDNNNSLVLWLNVNGKTFLFTGDMQFAEEQTLLEAGADLSADILKVANHGNPDATSNEFAQAVSPEIAVISTNTSVDTDSANEIVISALRGARVLVTENYECGILLTVNANGTVDISNPHADNKRLPIGLYSWLFNRYEHAKK